MDLADLGGRQRIAVAEAKVIVVGSGHDVLILERRVRSRQHSDDIPHCFSCAIDFSCDPNPNRRQFERLWFEVRIDLFLNCRKVSACILEQLHDGTATRLDS